MNTNQDPIAGLDPEGTAVLACTRDRVEVIVDGDRIGYDRTAAPGLRLTRHGRPVSHPDEVDELCDIAAGVYDHVPGMVDVAGQLHLAVAPDLLLRHVDTPREARQALTDLFADTDAAYACLQAAQVGVDDLLMLAMHRPSASIAVDLVRVAVGHRLDSVWGAFDVVHYLAGQVQLADAGQPGLTRVQAADILVTFQLLSAPVDPALAGAGPSRVESLMAVQAWTLRTPGLASDGEHTAAAWTAATGEEFIGLPGALSLAQPTRVVPVRLPLAVCAVAGQVAAEADGGMRLPALVDDPVADRVARTRLLLDAADPARFHHLHLLPDLAAVQLAAATVTVDAGVPWDVASRAVPWMLAAQPDHDPATQSTWRAVLTAVAWGMAVVHVDEVLLWASLEATALSWEQAGALCARVLEDTDR